MKQTAVEWLCEKYHLKQDIEIVKQAKVMEKQQQDEFAIGFAKWLVENDLYDEILLKVSDAKELLEIYKKEKGL
jgi:hypothetical protein